MVRDGRRAPRSAPRRAERARTEHTLNDLTKNIILWLIIAVVLLAVFSNFGKGGGQVQEIQYSQFLNDVDNNSVREAQIKGDDPAGPDRTRGVLAPAAGGRAEIEHRHAGLN